MKYAWLILMFYSIQKCRAGNKDNLMRMMEVVIKDTNTRIGHLSDILQTCHKRPAFEIGYLMYVIQEKYRRMVDKYHTALFMRRRYFVGEFVDMLVSVELDYWEVEHIGNMLHEIERKYNIKDDFDQDYELPPPTTEISSSSRRTRRSWKTKSKSMRKRHFNQSKYIMSRLQSSSTKRKNQTWWPIDYGWEIDYYWK